MFRGEPSDATVYFMFLLNTVNVLREIPLIDLFGFVYKPP